MIAPTIIVIPIYEGVTHIDFTGPHQVFARLQDAQTVVASVDARPVVADGLTFDKLAPLEAIERCDVLCVPGGQGCVEAIQSEPYMAAIRRLSATARYVTSVCTGSLILGAAGLLQGRRAACHWASRELLEVFGCIPDAGRVVRDGNLITGAGGTAGIDLAFALVGTCRPGSRADDTTGPRIRAGASLPSGSPGDGAACCSRGRRRTDGSHLVGPPRLLGGGGGGHAGRWRATGDRSPKAGVTARVHSSLDERFPPN